MTLTVGIGPSSGASKEYFSVGTGTRRVQRRQYFNYTLTNPPNSGVVAYVVQRRFINSKSGGDPLEFALAVNPNPLVGGTDIPPNNLDTSSTTTSACTFTYKLDSAPLSDVRLGSFYPLFGVDKVIEVVRMVGPGSSFGYTTMGQGSSELSPLVANNVIWYEVPEG